jgi:hypothetical protein
MSTLKTTFIQHPSATEPSIELSADGSIVLPLSGIGDLADVDEGSGAADGDVLTYDGVGNVWFPVAPAGGGFDASETITASNASWSVPALGSPIVKVTVVGGGGGGGAGETNTQVAGSAGGTTTFDAGVGNTVTAAGGAGATRRRNNFGGEKLVGTLGMASSNGGSTSTRNSSDASEKTGPKGGGGKIVVGYIDLTGLSTVNVTVGAGGAGAVSSVDPSRSGGDGGRGEVIVEYKAA